jgi:transposase
MAQCWRIQNDFLKADNRLGALNPPRTFKVMPRRWVVARTFAWLGRSRRLSEDDEFLPARSEAWIQVAMIRLLVSSLACPAS